MKKCSQTIPWHYRNSIVRYHLLNSGAVEHLVGKVYFKMIYDFARDTCVMHQDTCKLVSVCSSCSCRPESDAILDNEGENLCRPTSEENSSAELRCHIVNDIEVGKFVLQQSNKQLIDLRMLKAP